MGKIYRNKNIYQDMGWDIFSKRFFWERQVFIQKNERRGRIHFSFDFKMTEGIDSILIVLPESSKGSGKLCPLVRIHWRTVLSQFQIIYKTRPSMINKESTKKYYNSTRNKSGQNLHEHWRIFLSYSHVNHAGYFQVIFFLKRT